MAVIDDLADVRTGDKGDTLIVAVVARDDAAYRLLETHLSAEAVGERYAVAANKTPTRTLMPNVNAMVFNLPGVLGGGVTGSPVLDGHGKCLSYHLLDLELPA
ncbi:AtuA-related protein [Micrococcus lylae]|uniref:AtuA-like ferredoxin-fold domain-containing protein n=1 Tax=Micrococcus lylae TaxID=1273 RepID=A0ABY2K0S6_9MICC|nr:hypothetical protein [Micrococcus lylae]TFH98833.1 hypothetical protein E4A49_07660 [Micrococcus lylae]